MSQVSLQAVRNRLLDVGWDCTAIKEYDDSTLLLLGADGRPLAITYLIRQEPDSSVLHQALARSRSAKVDVLLLTEGHKVWLWRPSITAAPLERRRYYSPADLERLKRLPAKNLLSVPLSKNLASYSHLATAVARATGAAYQGQRRVLLGTATGTGRTLALVALVERFLATGYAGRVLILASTKHSEALFLHTLTHYNSELRVSRLEDIKGKDSVQICVGTWALAVRRAGLFRPHDYDVVVLDDWYGLAYRSDNSLLDVFDALILGMTTASAPAPLAAFGEMAGVDAGMGAAEIAVPTDEGTIDQAIKPKGTLGERIPKWPALLTIVPVAVNPHRQLILTCQPDVWKGAAPENRVIDLSGLIGEAFRSTPASDAMVPLHIDELRHMVQELAPEAVIVDYSVPWELVPGSGDGGICELLLRDADAPVIRHSSLAQALSAWVVTRINVKVLVVVCPRGWAVDESSDWWRAFVTRRLRLAAVVEGEGILPELHRMFVSDILYFGGDRTSAYFHAIKREQFDDPKAAPVFKDLTAWFEGKPPSVGFTKQLSTLTTWDIATNHPDVDRVRRGLEKIGPMVPVGEMCDIFLGVRRADVIEDPTGTMLIEGKHLLNGTLDTDLKKVRLRRNMPNSPWAQPGDLLFRRIVGLAEIVPTVFSNPASVLVSDSVVVVRPKPGAIASEYLREFFASSAGRRLVRASLAGGYVLYIRKLAALGVPVADEQTQTYLMQAAQQETELRAEADRMREKRRLLFQAETPKALRANLVALKRSGEVLLRSLEQAESLEFQIRNYYPFTMAYGYRLLGSIINPSELYWEQLRVVENLLAFLASVSLCLLLPEDRERLDLKAHFQTGASPGDWRDLAATAGKTLAQYKGNQLALAVSGLDVGSSKKGIGPEIGALIKALNDFKHGRRPAIESEFSKANTEVAAQLRRCMEGVAFLTEFPVRLVMDYDVSRSGVLTLTCLRYSGDHPGLAQERVTYDHPLKKGDLYMQVARNEWIALYPFISVRTCPTCHIRETFFVDYWFTGKGSVRLKSFERGHTEDDTDVAAALLDWPTAQD